MNWEQYQQAYQTADEKTKRLLDSPVIPDCVEVHKLDNSTHRAVVRAFTYLTLAIYTKDEVVKSLTDAGISDAEKMFEAIKDCIDSTPVPEPAPEETALELEQSIPVSEPTAHTQPAPAPAQAGYAAASAPQAAPAPTIAGLRQQAITTWGQYLSTVVGKDKEGLKETVATLAAQTAELQQSQTSVTPESDPTAYWHELKTRVRASAPHIDDAALERIRTAYATPGVAGEAGGIIKAIKQSAGA